MLGPHLEHPSYPEANDIFLRLIGAEPRPRPSVPSSNALAVPDPRLLRSITDTEIAVLGLEKRSFLVGSKLWDGSRFLELLAAAGKHAGSVRGDCASAVIESLSAVREDVISGSSDILLETGRASRELVEAARKCVDEHFQVLRSER